MDKNEKDALKRTLVQCLRKADEVRRIVLFGSFAHSDAPNDMDVAVFQDSDEAYLPLAVKYRRMAKPVSERIPLDIVPLRPDASGSFLKEILEGEVIYER